MFEWIDSQELEKYRKDCHVWRREDWRRFPLVFYMHYGTLQRDLMVHALCLDEDTLVYMYGILGISYLGTQVGMIL